MRMKSNAAEMTGTTADAERRGGSRLGTKKRLRVSEKEFVAGWMDAFAQGQNAAFVGFRLGLPGNQAHKRAAALRSKGVRLPFLFGERAALSPVVEELNQMIDARIKEAQAAVGARMFRTLENSRKGPKNA